MFTREGEHRDVNTAVHIMIDMSGSMDGNSSLGAKKAAYAFAKACASIKGVNVGVSVFNNAWSVGGKESRSVQTLVKHGERSIKSGLENLTRYSPGRAARQESGRHYGGPASASSGSRR